MDISERLDAAMKMAGVVSQSELARRSGVPQPTINRILKRTGSKGPEADTVRKLAAACNVSFDWLNEGIGPPGRARREPALAAVDMPPAAPVQSGTNMDDVIELIALFDQATPIGRRVILNAARSASSLAHSHWKRVANHGS